jgi:hypothetical protein
VTVKYKIIDISTPISTNSFVVEREDADGAKCWIPPDPTNSDYQQYLAWVAEGNTAEEWTGE